jgi:hypothetical protein
VLPPFAKVAPPQNKQVVTTPATALLALGCCSPRRCSTRVCHCQLLQPRISTAFPFETAVVT